MRIKLTGRMDTTFEGFLKLIRLYDRLITSRETSIALDCSGVTWIDANMCSPLGAILYKIQQEGHRTRVIGLRQQQRKILAKNGFLSSFGQTDLCQRDSYSTTIEYKRFGCSDLQGFKSYVSQHFVGKGIPEMSKALQKRFRESISEIFQNAVDHSNTQFGIFACGQYFPKMSRLDFSITDLGIGIRENIRRHIGLDLRPEQAVIWATEGDNTTRHKTSMKPGGIGLKLIKDFIDLNNGQIHIISGAGYYNRHSAKITSKGFGYTFPGTIVNIEINTADAKEYYLASERKNIDPKSIF